MPDHADFKPRDGRTPAYGRRGWHGGRTGTVKPPFEERGMPRLHLSRTQADRPSGFNPWVKDAGGRPVRTASVSVWSNEDRTHAVIVTAVGGAREALDDSVDLGPAGEYLLATSASLQWVEAPLAVPLKKARLLAIGDENEEWVAEARSEAERLAEIEPAPTPWASRAGPGVHVTVHGLRQFGPGPEAVRAVRAGLPPLKAVTEDAEAEAAATYARDEI